MEVQAIPSATNIEKLVRNYLFRKGLRYRNNVKELPGQPDIVLPKYKTVIFVHGCFWHQHQYCKKGLMRPKTNQAFWDNKLDRNIIRDKENEENLKALGWKVLIVWECEIKMNQSEAFDSLYKNIYTKSIGDS